TGLPAPATGFRPPALPAPQRPLLRPQPLQARPRTAHRQAVFVLASQRAALATSTPPAFRSEMHRDFAPRGCPAKPFLLLPAQLDAPAIPIVRRSAIFPTIRHAGV